MAFYFPFIFIRVEIGLDMCGGVISILVNVLAHCTNLFVCCDCSSARIARTHFSIKFFSAALHPNCRIPCEAYSQKKKLFARKSGQLCVKNKGTFSEIPFVSSSDATQHAILNTPHETWIMQRGPGWLVGQNNWRSLMYTIGTAPKMDTLNIENALDWLVTGGLALVWFFNYIFMAIVPELSGPSSVICVQIDNLLESENQFQLNGHGIRPAKWIRQLGTIESTTMENEFEFIETIWRKITTKKREKENMNDSSINKIIEFSFNSENVERLLFGISMGSQDCRHKILFPFFFSPFIHPWFLIYMLEATSNVNDINWFMFAAIFHVFWLTRWQACWQRALALWNYFHE